MPHTIKEWPSAERPRERLETAGPRALSPRELLAIVLETGQPAAGGQPARSALDLAGDLIRHCAAPDGGLSLRRMMSGSLADLRRVPGIGPAKATKVLAALELGRRAVEEARPDRERVRSGAEVYERMRLRLRDLLHEEFHVLLLSTQQEKPYVRTVVCIVSA